MSLLAPKRAFADNTNLLNVSVPKAATMTTEYCGQNIATYSAQYVPAMTNATLQWSEMSTNTSDKPNIESAASFDHTRWVIDTESAGPLPDYDFSYDYLIH